MVKGRKLLKIQKRETGIEPATSSLVNRRSIENKQQRCLRACNPYPAREARWPLPEGEANAATCRYNATRKTD